MFKSSVNSEERLPLLVQKNDEQVIYVQYRSENYYKYPKAVLFVLISKFFEALSANGIRTILALYLRDALFFTESIATIILHIFNFFSQFCPLFGAILADNYVGNAKTISYFNILYTIGWIGLILTSFPHDELPIVLLISLSLLFISIGNGCIRACITSLGAKQFQLPEQNDMLQRYFSHYYFVYYIGIFLSKILPPLIRRETKCFGKDNCYLAVFGTLGGSFLFSLVIILIGVSFYKNDEPAKENVLVNFIACIKFAIIQKFKNRDKDKTSWLKQCSEKYSIEFVKDMQKVLRITKLFIPLPIYWALLAQQDSTWTFQASQLKTSIFDFHIEPDQVKAIGPIILFVLIPSWQYIVKPILKCFNIVIHPLHSVAIGGICSAMAFVCSGILQQYIEIREHKTLSFSWQIPQFTLLMMGELFLSIPGLEFAFTQAPPSMKSVLTAIWFLNNAIGNLIVIGVTKINLAGCQSSEYFIYAGLMFSAIIIFTIMADTFIKKSEFLDLD